MKRTAMISNRSLVRKLDKGKVPKQDRKCEYPTSHKSYKSGKQVWTASRFLKKTQLRGGNSFNYMLFHHYPIRHVLSCIL